jgi:hypothetical protein
MSTYSVDTHNLFSLLDGDGNAAAKKAAPAKAVSKPAATTGSSGKSSEGDAKRGGGLY